MSIERIADTRCETGEGPMWHPGEECLYWIDIQGKKLYRYDPESEEYERLLNGYQIGGYTINVDGSLLLFMDQGQIARWDGTGLQTLIDELPDEQNSRFNDVIADPLGRVFCGTMPTENELGSLYRLELDGSITRVVDGVAVANGLGFTLDRRSLYFTESRADRIYRFEYDQSTGAIGNREVFVDATDEDGVPDGMTVDAEGNVWSARWNGGCMVKHAPDGSELDRIEFPAKKVSSVTIAGPDYQTAYVTTAGGDNRADEGDGAGALFRLPLDVAGVPEFPSRFGAD